MECRRNDLPGGIFPEQERAGFYIHVPFCVKKCIYCDFLSDPGCSEEQIRLYFQAVEKEIQILLQGSQEAESGTMFISSDRRKSALENHLRGCAAKALPADSVFFGGGTPSLADPSSIQSVLSLLPLTADAEITMEANPGTLTPEKLRAFRSCGINRVSLGVQSFQDHELAFLGRIHDSREAVETIREVRRAGFDNLNIDLIFGFPGQTLTSWKQTLQTAIELQPEHLSFYSLQIEEGTPLYRLFREDQVEQIPDELNREMYHYAVEILKSSGYGHYEISNAALPGRECRHNLKYWTMTPYFGLGAGSHSFLGGVRYFSPDSREGYLHLVDGMDQQSSCFLPRGEDLIENTVEDSMSDYLFTGLRLIGGISVSRFEQYFGINFSERYREALDRHLKDGTMELREGFLRFTEKGLDLSNYILMDFI